ncbi:MAG TPA: GntR family transcriptional regulator [Actinomycetes bacterium]|jgi:DNA-binding GntR family transcriptional regulator|nr:GntR family transcriptional regulator [Actinomycetes bacterium]
MIPQRYWRAETGIDLPSLPLEPVPTAAERAAERIRELIFQGRFPPGVGLPESRFAGAFQVSRNTVREAFRLLINENLLSYEMHRGVFVRQLDENDIHDIYQSRRGLELAALAAFDAAGADLSRLTRAVEDAERVAAAADWREVGTANLRFHEELVAFLGSPRRSHFFHALMTEVRLGFCAVSDFRELHEPYVHWNRRLRDLLAAGELQRARRELEGYLARAEQQIAEAVRAAPGPGEDG